MDIRGTNRFRKGVDVAIFTGIKNIKKNETNAMYWYRGVFSGGQLAPPRILQASNGIHYADR